MGRAVALVVAVALLLGGWVALTPARGYDLPVGGRGAPRDAVVAAHGTSLWIDDVRHRADPAPTRLVSAEGGIYYTSGGRLWRWSPAGSRDVARVGSADLTVSPDGRYLAYVDFEHGPLTPSGQRLAETVAFDTRTGERLLRDGTGMGSRTENPADLYDEGNPDVLGFLRDRLVVQPTDGDPLSFDLRTGRHRSAASGLPPTRTALGDQGLVALRAGRGRFEPVDGDDAGTEVGVRSPDGRTTAYTDGSGRLWLLRAGSDGTGVPRRVEVPGSTTVLAGWVDERTFVVQVESFDRTRLRLQALRCRTSGPSARCTAVTPVLPSDRDQVVVANTDVPS